MKLKRVLRVWGFAILFAVMLCGCKPPNTEYVIPTDIYGVQVPADVEWPEVRRIDLPTKGQTLQTGDFCLVPDEFTRIQLLQTFYTEGLEKVETYKQESGEITEWREPNGNYKILTYKDKDGKDRVVGAITISRYITTGRGCRNQLTAQEVDVLFNGCTYTVDMKSDQENRIYQIQGMKLILTLKYDVVRSIQILADFTKETL